MCPLAVVLRDEFALFAVGGCLGAVLVDWFLKWSTGACGQWTRGGAGWPAAGSWCVLVATDKGGRQPAWHGRQRREPTKPPSETGQLGTARREAGSSRVLLAGVVGGGAACT